MIKPVGYPSRRRSFLQSIRTQWLLLLLTVPVILYVLLFVFVPLYNWLWAFFDYKAKFKSIFDAPFVGLKYFRELFAAPGFWLAIRNTLVLSVMSITLGTAGSIFFALMLNESSHRKVKRMTQTVSYLPHFISWVIVVNIFTNLLKMNNGVLNTLLVNLGILDAPYPFLLQGSLYWILVTLMGIWKETGWGTIIYLSAMTSIDEALYEAAYVDGATRIKRIWHITLPGISEIIVLLLIMNIGTILGTGYEQSLLLSNGANIEYADVLTTYTIRYGLKMGRISFATTATIFQSVIGFLLVLGANAVSKRVSDIGLF